MKILVILLLLLTQSFSLAKAMTDEQAFLYCKDSLLDIKELSKGVYCLCLVKKAMKLHGESLSTKFFLEVQKKESNNCKP